MVETGLSEVVTVRVVEGVVEGEVALKLEPGTRADAQRGALDRVLSLPLAEAAASLDLVLAARPSAFVLPKPGRDDEGRTHYLVRGRREGDRLVPALRPPNPRERSRHKP